MKKHYPEIQGVLNPEIQGVLFERFLQGLLIVQLRFNPSTYFQAFQNFQSFGT